MLKSVMVGVLIGAGLVEEASAASRRDQTGRREIEYASASKAVTERDPRRPCGNSPDIRDFHQRLLSKGKLFKVAKPKEIDLERFKTA